MLPTVTADELARRVHITYPAGPLDPQLEACIAVAVELLTPHVDETLAAVSPGAWSEAVNQLGVKLWDTAAKGLSGMDATGEFTFPAPAATVGLVDAVKGLWAPLTATGGYVVA